MTDRAYKGLLALSLVSVLLAAGSSAVPSIAHAGVFPGVFSAFTSTVQAFAAEATGSNNVQTMALPAPATNIDPNPSVGGGNITIVDESALLSEEGPGGTAADIEDAQSRQISIYVVRKGDTLSDIATMFDVSVNTIMWSNGLSRGQSIREGQTLTILPITGIKHTIKKGDTLTSVAKKYSGDESEIIQFNGLAVDAALAVGTEIIIPNGEIAPSTIAKVTTTKKAASVGGPSYSGYYTTPLAKYVRTQGIHGYNGVDMAAPSGTPVMAAAAGEVIVSRPSGWNGGYGIYVVIRHSNGTQTLYSHMSADFVSVGQYVAQGEVIGSVGNTGLSTGPHLHFEVRGAKNPF